MDDEECQRFDRLFTAAHRFYHEMCNIPEMGRRNMADACAGMLAVLLEKAWSLHGKEGLDDLLTEFAATFTAVTQDDPKVRIQIAVNIIRGEE